MKFVNENQDDWDVHIKSIYIYILFAYRTSKNDSTNFTPFELMFGRAPILPIEMEIASHPKPHDEDLHAHQSNPLDFQGKVDVMMAIRQKVKAKAMKNIDKAQERQKKS